MNSLKNKLNQKKEELVSPHGLFKNEQGALDLSSIMVGIIVIGLIGGVIAATVFAVIPWAQDNAAKQQLNSIAAAESSFLGLSSDPTAPLGSGSKTNSYGTSRDLKTANLMPMGVTYCAATPADGKGYEAYSKSSTGNIWSISDKNTKPIVFNGTLPASCKYLITGYIDPKPTTTILTYRCSSTTTAMIPMSSNLVGTETWSDGTPVRTYNGNATAQTKTLNALTTYTVTFEGTYNAMNGNVTPEAYAASNSCLRSVDHWGTETGVVDASKAFYAAGYLTDVPEHLPSSITNMAEMFRSANGVNDPDISKWDVSAVTNMSYIFWSASEFNQPLNDWDVSRVTNMDNMLGSGKFNQNLDKWKTSNVTSMKQMFALNGSFNGAINNWDVSKVTAMTQMFSSATSFNQPLDNWTTSALKDTSYMFNGATSFDQPINTWNVSGVTNMSYMFQNNSKFNRPLNSWNVSSVTNMSGMFWGASAFNGDIVSWVPSKVTNMSYMFAGDPALNRDLSTWNTAAVTVGHNFAPNTFPTLYLPARTTKQP